MLEARTVVWLSDGGRCFWRLFNDQFRRYAQGILDFYHAAQNIWKGARALFDGRTKKARQWFASARRRLRSGKAKEVLDCHHRSKNQPKASFTNQPERSKGAPMRFVLFKKTHKSLSSF